MRRNYADEHNASMMHADGQLAAPSFASPTRYLQVMREGGTTRHVPVRERGRREASDRVSGGREARRCEREGDATFASERKTRERAAIRRCAVTTRVAGSRVVWASNLVASPS